MSCRCTGTARFSPCPPRLSMPPPPVITGNRDPLLDVLITGPLAIRPGVERAVPFRRTHWPVAGKGPARANKTASRKHRFGGRALYHNVLENKEINVARPAVPRPLADP